MNNTRVTIVLAVKGFMAMLAFVLAQFGIELSVEAALGGTGVLELLALLLLPDDLWARIGRRIKKGGPPGALLLVFALPVLGSGCATADCEVIYSRARAWRAVAVASGAGSAAAGVGSIPATSEAEIGLAIGGAVLAGGTAAAGFLADSYADEYRGYCRTSTRAE